MAEFELHNAGNSEAQQKEALSRIFAPAGVLAAPGVLDGLVVAQNTTADGNVLIGAGSCVLHPTMTAGCSLLMNDTTKTLNIFTANPVGGLPRNDIVVFDSLTAAITVIIGTPNATPSDPTVPNTSLALARLRHAASAPTIPTAKIDNLIVTTTLRGILAPVVDTGWMSLVSIGATWNAPFGGSAVTARRIGNRVQLTGLQRANASTIAIGTTTGLGTLPAGMYPPNGFYGWAVGWINGGTDIVAEVVITGGGVISVVANSVLTGIRFHNISFLTD